MNRIATAVFDFLLLLLLVSLPILYLPYGEEPFRQFREMLFHIFMLGIVLAWISRALTARDGSALDGIMRHRSAVVPVALFFFSSTAFWLSLILNGSGTLQTGTAINYMLGGILFVAFLDAMGRIGTQKWLPALKLVLLVNAGYGILQYLGFDFLFTSLDPEWHTRYPRYLVAGFMDSPNMLAPLLVSIVPYLFCRFIFGKSAKDVYWPGLFALLILIPVFLSENLAGIIALGAVMAVLLVYFSIHTFRHGKAGALRVGFGWVVALVAIAVGITGYMQSDGGTRVMKKWSMNERTTQYRAAWMMFAESPALGKGPNSFYKHFVEYRRAVWFSNPPVKPPHRTAHQVHNEYLQLLAEGGAITALPVFAILFIFLFRQALFMKKRLDEKEFSPRAIYAIGAAGGFWTIVINGGANFPFHIAPLAVIAIFWAAVCHRNMYDDSVKEAGVVGAVRRVG